MKTWLKENWFKLGILIVVFIVGISFIQKNQTTENKAEGIEINTGKDKNLDFNINTSNLSYELPSSFSKICTPKTKFYCSAEGCEPIKPSVFLLYDEDNSFLYRCDTKPCDRYKVQKNQSGLFTNLQPIEPSGFSVKISSDNKYFETVSLGLDILLSYGVCE